ncbi:MAG TPA: carbamate kinase [bacterium]|jgi:carbamate kinase|nr:carbamate kinase [bacterium]HPK14312.1 carbamate kinase [Candidatus Paceibacterota bacterium]HNZ51323.1 carbamate kinase [bacterium]HOF79669.1 carbamate kinase [bacterium]HOH85210.1 carbamate kinase [bacterium]
MKKLAVVAFGGNALLRAGEKGTIEEQETNVYQTCAGLLGLIEQDYNIVIGHGNGPQVGNILLQVNAGEKLYGIPEMPMDICGAYSQGFIGYIIEQQFKNLLNQHKLNRQIVSIITQVIVDKNDSAFQNPTKPVGPYYSEEEMHILQGKNPTHAFAEDPKGKGWRRVVASPQPLVINNTSIIEELARKGHIVITVGGGGIPVFYATNDTLQGIDAVIDKDLASSLLAVKINADEFYILTDVPKVFINFRQSNEQALDVITVAEAKSYLQQGQFTEGSMAPKIRAAINFVENGGKECIITEAGQLSNPDCGTRIIA